MRDQPIVHIATAATACLFAATLVLADPPATVVAPPIDPIAVPVPLDQPPTQDGARNQDCVTILSVEAARERATLMHNIYSATLEMMHHRYFNHDRATIPARALEDVFAEIDRQANIKSRWIAVSSRAMSIEHEPEGDFELAAVKAIRQGEDHFERTSEATYRRVGAIRLSGGCMNCHGRFGSTSTSKKFAGLVIEIPLQKAPE